MWMFVRQTKVLRIVSRVNFNSNGNEHVRRKMNYYVCEQNVRIVLVHFSIVSKFNIKGDSKIDFRIDFGITNSLIIQYQIVQRFVY